jgi:MerR family copper efflux transcriptional regulator
MFKLAAFVSAVSVLAVSIRGAHMNIGQAAQRTGLSAKAIRYYEDIGLVIPPRQAGNSYRHYRQTDLDELGFLQHARAVGFSLDECRTLLELYRNPQRQSAHVKQLVLDKIAHLDQQMASLTAMQRALSAMAQACSGDDDPHCAIIDNLAAPTPFSPMSFTLVEAPDE